VVGRYLWRIVVVVAGVRRMLVVLETGVDLRVLGSLLVL
jgi:hypothetical protein